MSILAILAALMFSPMSDSAADLVTLRDGKVLRGQVYNPDDQGLLIFIIRRAWAQQELPEQAKTWRAAELPWMKRARAERLARLQAWSRERRAVLSADQSRQDPILRWLDDEIAHLSRLGPDDELPRLMMVALARREVKSVSRRPPELARLLRLGWRAGFPDVESMKPDDLKRALEGRNFDVAGQDPAPINDLLPTPIESDARWLARRAATEIVQDGAEARFVRHGDFVMAEGASGQPIDLNGALSGLLGSALGGNLADLGLGGDLAGLGLGGNPGGPGVGRRPAADPLEPKLRALAAEGRVGAILTRLEIAPDLAGVQVETTLLARLGPENWRPVATRSATLRTDQLPPDAANPIAADPQVQAVFNAADALGLGISPQMKQRALAIGSATQAALGRAGVALQADLDALALPVVGSP